MEIMLLKTCLPIILTFSLLSFSACKKKDAPAPVNTVEEEGLRFELPEIQEGKYNIALDSTYTFTVNITSRLPEKGVAVSLNVVSEINNIPLPQEAVPDAHTGTFRVTLRHLRGVKTYMVTLGLASLGNTANVSTPHIFYITNKSNQ
ncbi:hypothetical protein [Chitinophaga nivalis]|uniref:DUF1735 domain-containing protein n=1 Tax=Chitinophaga nivalis TaxID=2991709 RepID=A0ABT3IWA7_9BACT|nr:hypothetical protein [Chitinophaga nivalis]MCW3462127.1 hypothetical protein [Chitinophaga nivalis]MCW3488181.1 hypothetical protein [Chitinophaga nivalis]